MIFLFSDYGLQGPYIGQVKAVLSSLAPQETVIDLLADAPRYNPRASAWLLASLVTSLPAHSVLFCVVDPGVGMGKDRPVAIKVDGRWFVGPDNGLFDIVCRGAGQVQAMTVDWRPDCLSNSFHGRDLYAPVCAKLANNQMDFGRPFTWQDQHAWPADLYEIIYIDHFGNCMTGLGGSIVATNQCILLNGIAIDYATVFAEVGPDQAFWYINANNLLEIAVNQGSAADVLGISVGTALRVV